MIPFFLARKLKGYSQHGSPILPKALYVSYMHYYKLTL